MAATADDVRAITGLPTTISDAAIAPFLAVANNIVGKISACLTSKGIADTDIIVSWLAAHYISLSPVGKEANSIVKERFENYQVETSTSGVSEDLSSIMSTRYGQTANDLSAGCLKSFALRSPKIGFY